MDEVLTFDPTTSRVPVPISIIADIFDEPAENLFANLELISSDADNVILMPDETEVVIADVPRKYCIAIPFHRPACMEDQYDLLCHEPDILCNTCPHTFIVYCMCPL